MPFFFTTIFTLVKLAISPKVIIGTFRSPKTKEMDSKKKALTILQASQWNYKSQYKKLIRKEHPDKGGDLKKCQTLTEAYRYMNEYFTPL